MLQIVEGAVHFLLRFLDHVDVHADGLHLLDDSQMLNFESLALTLQLGQFVLEWAVLNPL